MNRNKKNYRRRQNMDTKSKRPTEAAEVEVDIPRDAINRADLATKGKKYVSKKNDGDWYAKNSALLQAAASFPFGYPIGVALPGSSLTVGKQKDNIPGLMTIQFVPTIGKSTDASSPINLAAKLQYSNIRYANSGTTYGDPSDLMMYYLSIDSMYLFHQMLVRAYGVLRTYNYQNRYFPQAIIEAMGFNFSDLNDNITQLWGYINTFGVKLQAFAVPGDMSYFVRHAWMASGIYLDGNTSKAQSYMYMPVGFYKWTEVADGPNKLTMVSPFVNDSNSAWPFPTIATGQLANAQNSKLLTLASLMKFGDSLMQPVLASESFGVTTGAILKAFGTDNLMKIGQIALDYQVIPAYNAEVLSQIENATIYEGVEFSASIGNFDITQDTGVDDNFIIAQPALSSVTFSTASTVSDTSLRYLPFLMSTQPKDQTIINMHIEQPTPTDFMVATRLTSTCSQPSGISGGGTNVLRMKAALKEFASEVVVGATITTIRNQSTGTDLPVEEIYQTPYSSGFIAPGAVPTNYEWWLEGFRSVASIQNFDWHPSCYLCYTSATLTAPAITANQPVPTLSINFKFDTRDIDNFALVQDDNLALLNQCAMLSLFDSPRVAQLTSKPYKR